MPGSSQPLTPENERALVDKARANDREALSTLLRVHEDGARRLLRLLVGHPDDLNDLMQDAMVDAFTGLAEMPREAGFGPWLQTLALGKASAFLALQRRWRVAAQALLESLVESHDLLGEVMEAISDDDFAYDVRNHVAFCFSAVGRSLPLEQQTALVLVDVLGLSTDDAASALKARPVDVQRFLDEARVTISETYDKLCGLSNPDAPCHHCQGLRTVSPEGRKGPDPDRLHMDVDVAEDRLRRRFKLVREAELDHGPDHKLHDLLYRLMSDNEANRTSPSDKDLEVPRMTVRWEALLSLQN